MKKKNNKIIVALMLSIFFILGACSNDGGSDNDSEKALQVWTMSQGLDEFVTDFENESGINIEVQSIPWDKAHDKLLTAVASGKGPDVLQIGNTWVAEFAEAGTFLDLTDHIDDYSNLSQENFFESAVATTQYEDQIIGIPWYVDTRVLFYRTDLLADVGYPEGPETWDEMLDASRQFADRGEGQFGIEMPQTDPQFPFMLAWEQGWNYEIDKGAANFEEPEFKEAVELYTTFFEEGLTQTEEGKELAQAFGDGSKPMFFSGPWSIGTTKENNPDIEGKWDVRVMPKGENNLSMMGGAHLSVFHNTDKVDQALEFINWMSKPETQLAWYELNSELPASKEAWEDPILADDPMVSTFGEQLESTQPLPLIPEYERIGNELLNTLEQIHRGGADIDEALEVYREEVKSILSD